MVGIEHCAEDQPVVVAALYHFTPLAEPAAFRESLRATCAAAGLLGTLIVAPEGVNGTVAGTREGIDALLRELRSHRAFANLEHKEAQVGYRPFVRLKVHLKKEIVSLGRPDLRPFERTGRHVGAAEWNALLDDPECVVIDTRNHYETDIGTFEGALIPNTDSFGEFPAYVDKHFDKTRHKKVAMFCTGGIRCEKASAYMLEQGFAEVYQLKGGILKYFEETSAAESRWRGECFVFDGRVAVTEALEPGVHELCYGCRMPVSPADRLRPEFEEGICCHRCAPTLSATKRARLVERMRQVTLAKQRGCDHLGQDMYQARRKSQPAGKASPAETVPVQDSL